MRQSSTYLTYFFLLSKQKSLHSLCQHNTDDMSWHHTWLWLWLWKLILQLPVICQLKYEIKWNHLLAELNKVNTFLSKIKSMCICILKWDQSKCIINQNNGADIRHTETISAMQRFRLPLSSLMVIGRSSLILSMASGQSSCETKLQ